MPVTVILYNIYTYCKDRLNHVDPLAEHAAQHDCMALLKTETPPPPPGGGGGGTPIIKMTGMLVVPFRGQNHGFGTA